jgi:hypothetical protein
MADESRQRTVSDEIERSSTPAEENAATTTTSDDADDTTSQAEEASLVESSSTAGDLARVQEELAALKSTVAALIAEARGGAAKTLRAAGDLVSHKVEAAGHIAAAKGSALAETASERAQGLAAELESFARRRPLSAIAAAMLAGVVIGMLGRRRS